MYYKLYIDSVFFIQFVMNLYLLSITGKILKCTATHGRIIPGALAGAGMICLVILLPVGSMRIRLLIGVIPVSMAMIRIAFALRAPKLLMRACMTMALCGFFMGSIVLWLIRRGGFMNRTRYGIRTFALFAFFAYIVLEVLWRWHRMEKESNIRQVRIPAGEKSIRMTAFIDTGNHLSEPISGAPVCIISESAAKQFQGFFLPERYHAIPYRSIGRKQGILNAYELPEMVIEDTCREICCKRVIIAICNTGISQDSAYQMILHPGLIEN